MHPRKMKHFPHILYLRDNDVVQITEEASLLGENVMCGGGEDNALVRDGWVQKERERLYSRKKEKRFVESRGKNFRAIGVP